MRHVLGMVAVYCAGCVGFFACAVIEPICDEEAEWVARHLTEWIHVKRAESKLRDEK